MWIVNHSTQAGKPAARNQLEIGDGGIPADRRHVAEVAVSKRLARLTLHRTDDRLRREVRLLHCDLGHARRIAARWILEAREVADDEHFRMTGDRKIGLNEHAPGLVGRNAERLAERRRGDAGRPHHRPGLDRL